MNKHLSMYIHIPFCVSKCNYCDFVSFACSDDLFSDYFKALNKQIRENSQKVKLIDTIFIGGGTPSYVPEKYIEEIINNIKNNYLLTDDCEISIESNPDSLNRNKLATYRDLGINRLSIGVQTFNDKILKILGRAHDSKTALKRIEDAKNAGFNNINADLMFSLPTEDLHTLEKDLDILTSEQISHISAYSLIVEENTRFSDFYKYGTYVYDDGLDREMYHFAKKYLSAEGYEQYEISNFSKNGFKCMHNYYCWKLEEYYGFGCSAHGYFNNVRYANYANIPEYIDSIMGNKDYPYSEIQDECLNKEDYIMLGFRTIPGIDVNDYNLTFNSDFYKEYSTPIKKNIKNGLVEIENDLLTLTDKGMDFANSVIFDFISDHLVL